MLNCFYFRDFYELDNFPVHCLLTRCSIGKKKNIYYSSSSIRDIVNNNQERVKVIYLLVF